MKFSFKTRDLGPANDYPAIGWMPLLPKGTEQLWRQYGTLGSEERPQLVVSGNGTEWQIYLEGMDSGRTDSATGVGGRIIRMSLFLTGAVAEANLAYPLLDRYVNRVLLNHDLGSFREIFASVIKPGDPFKWRNSNEDAQAIAATTVWESLKSALSTIQQVPCSSDADLGLAAGLSPSNAARFLRVCGSLLTGKTSGKALALADARLSDLATLNTAMVVSMLSLDQHDDKDECRLSVGSSSRVDYSARNSKISGVAPVSDRIPSHDNGVSHPVSDSSEWGSPSRRSVLPPGPEHPEKRKRIAAFFAVALTVLIALLTLLIKSCQSSKTTSAHPPHQAEPVLVKPSEQVHTNQTAKAPTNRIAQDSINTNQDVHHGN